MEVDDVVMRTGDDETSTGWCFALTSMCAVVGSTGSLLLDSGSDEHLCTLKFADLIPTSRDRSPLKVKDVQQNELVISGQKTVPMLVGPTGGKHAMEATATFRVAEVRDNILSLGKLVRKGFRFNLGPGGCSMEKDGRKVPLYLERNSLRVEAHVLQRASRPGYVAAGERDERMDGMDVKESHSSSSSGPAVEPSAEARTTPAPVLKTWSSIRELHSRLRDLGAPIHGTKDVLFRRLCEYEQIAVRKKKKEDEYLESRKKELVVATEPVTPKISPGQAQPSEVERQHHMENHLPPAPWCELCVMGRGKDDPHLRSDLREKGEQLPMIAFDFAFVKITSEQKYATTLVAVDADLFSVKVIPVLRKETTDYSATGLIKFIEVFFHKHVRLRCDGEPATVALANKMKNMAGDLVKFETTPKHSSASNPAERAIQAVEEQSRTIRADCQMRFGSGETCKPHQVQVISGYSRWSATAFEI